MTTAAARRRRRPTAVLLGTAVLVWAAGSAGATLDGLRAQKRTALAEAVAEHGEQHARLLVIPVDFTDARLPAAWNPRALASVLSGPGLTMEGWWSDASGGLLNLRTVLAPTVHLPGARRDYSDRDLGGELIRSRLLASSALELTRQVLPLRLADGDGPDGLAATADDDGEVDGVLLLHAGPGLENDPVDGLIQPLQSWLLEPVTDRGTTASLYATASLQSGLGVWLHESAHLLGLEDRYDLQLSGGGVDGETAARGGLGRFSLMAAGYDDAATAHLDAYSRIQLGWTTPLFPGQAAVALGPAWDRPVRIDLITEHGAPACYYLLETLTDPQRAGPALAVYQVDEGVPEDGQSSSDPETRHLRVRLVEADGGHEIARGMQTGAVQDLFPTDATPQDWTSASQPGTGSYGGQALFELLGITTTASGVTAAYRPLPGGWTVDLFFLPTPADTTLQVSVDATDSAAPATVDLRIDDGSGSFGGLQEVTVALVEAQGHFRLAEPLPWRPTPSLASGDVSRLTAQVNPGGAPQVKTWSWGSGGFGLNGWPQGWRDVDDGWADWSEAPFAAPGGPLVAGTGVFAAVGDWPDVSVGNGAVLEMTSPPLPPGLGAHLLHWYDLGPGPDGFRGDGAVLEYVLQDGTRRRAVPQGGYPGVVAQASTTALAGDAAFVGPGELDDVDAPLWRRDWIPPPDTAAPYRLAFRLETDALWAGRGWWLRELAPLAAPEPGLLAPVFADGVWTWSGAGGFRVQLSGDGGATWVTVGAPVEPVYNAAEVARDLAALGLSRALLRVQILDAGHRRVTRAVAVASDRTADPLRALAVWPNPARDACRIHLRVPDGTPDPLLDLYDLRGRRQRRWSLGPGEQVVAWDGRDDDGRRLPAGRYLLRARLGGSTLRRSVILLP